MRKNPAVLGIMLAGGDSPFSQRNLIHAVWNGRCNRQGRNQGRSHEFSRRRGGRVNSDIAVLTVKSTVQGSCTSGF